MPSKINSETNYNHLGWSYLVRWDILWIGFTFAESWWADKVTGCTSSHLKHRHESRTGVSWVYQSCQSINDNSWARTLVGGGRKNENDHGEQHRESDELWRLKNNDQNWMRLPAHTCISLTYEQEKSESIEHRDWELDLVLLIPQLKWRIFDSILGSI